MNKQITINQLLKESTATLVNAGIASARLDARVLLEAVLLCDHAYIIGHHGDYISQENIDKYNKLLARRIKHEPVAKITGKREFWSLDFKTSHDTLDPRPDSETLIETVMKLREDRSKNYQILDFGTGTGCLLLSLLSEYTNANGVGVDISSSALNIAKDNAQQLQMDKKCKFVLSDWGENIENKYDIIISNPPYIPTKDIENLDFEVLGYDPHLALDGGDDGMEKYRDVAPYVKKHLNDNGIAIFEIGRWQELELQKICSSNGLKMLSMEYDLAGIIRCVAFCHE